MLMKSPTIHRVLVYAGREGIPGWWTYGFMSPTPHSPWDVPQKPKKCDKKHCVSCCKCCRARKKRYIVRDFSKNTLQLAKLSFNHPSVVLTADVFHFFIKKYFTYECCSSMEEQYFVFLTTAVLEKITNPTTWNHIFKLRRWKSRCLEDVLWTHFSTSLWCTKRMLGREDTSKTFFKGNAFIQVRRLRHKKALKTNVLQRVLLKKKFACGGLYDACVNPFFGVS